MCHCSLSVTAVSSVARVSQVHSLKSVSVNSAAELEASVTESVCLSVCRSVCLSVCRSVSVPRFSSLLLQWRVRPPLVGREARALFVSVFLRWMVRIFDDGFFLLHWCWEPTAGSPHQQQQQQQQRQQHRYGGQLPSAPDGEYVEWIVHPQHNR